MSARTWSAEQSLIFSNVANGKGHTVVTAMPGAGKTTTLVASLSHIAPSERTILLAFNKKIADELSTRAPRHVEVSTTHSYGLRLCRNANPRVKIDNNKMRRHLSEKLFKAGASKLVSLAKATLAETVDDLVSLMAIHDIDSGDMSAREYAEETHAAMVSSSQDHASVDFDDMIWFPHIFGLGGGTYDRVFIDEAQDFTDAQLELSLNAVSETGRILAVGDPRQAISSFRGASLDAFARLTTRLAATVLSLPVSYRCARAIVAEAATVVPEIRSHENAEDGIVAESTVQKMIADVRAGDFIISRANAPLVSLVFSFLAAGRKANIQGRDIGKTLRKLVERIGGMRKVTDMPSFVAAVGEYHDRESAKLEAAKKPTDALDDKIACIHALTSGAESLNEILDRCDNLFSDSDDETDKIILTSAHRSKGLERERVFVITETFRKRPGLEEDNLYYVAVTRAKRELYLVRGKVGAEEV